MKEKKGNGERSVLSRALVKGDEMGFVMNLQVRLSTAEILCLTPKRRKNGNGKQMAQSGPPKRPEPIVGTSELYNECDKFIDNCYD